MGNLSWRGLFSCPVRCGVRQVVGRGWTSPAAEADPALTPDA
ncbi:hypothetical protein DA2_2665 [Desulfovibrio sp. A2]|nr:hypothetical protein DA2_2665 [Desulfovibrio sp. A2]